MAEITNAKVEYNYEYSHSYRAGAQVKLTQLNGKLSAIYSFVECRTGHKVADRGAAKIYLWQFIDEIDAKTSPIKQVMRAMRDARKQELYNTASAAIT